MPLRLFRTPAPHPVAREKNTATLLQILTGLPRRKREALISFYCDRRSERDIEAVFGIAVDEFRELRRSTRAAFDRMTRCA